MSSYVLDFQDIDRTAVALVGGKGAHLGELSRIDGIHVPPGFCITTVAFQQVMAAAPPIGLQLDQLARVEPNDRESIRALSAAVRQTIETIEIPNDLAAAITASIVPLGAAAEYAVRSSATAEDLPNASFAGQQDSYLNIAGPAAILEHVRRCWASLFTERAVTYRIRNGYDHRKVHMAVVVQRMVFPQASGVLFTADPITGNRKVSSVEAILGLGEALVSGLVNADVYKVQGGVVTATTRQAPPVLTERHVVRLADLGRRIEAHFGCPQDIEWCLADDEFAIVQSRPITTLFPIPEPRDGENHVYVSVGHQQMMTDPFKPLGLSFWQMTTPAQMAEAGGRLFVDVTKGLGPPSSRARMVGMLGKSDPLIGDALQTILDRGDFVPVLPDTESGWSLPGSGHAPIETDPAIPADLIARSEASIADLTRAIAEKSGPALMDAIWGSLEDRTRAIHLDPLSMQVIIAGMEATWWLNDKLEEWLGEKNAADVLAQSVPNNVTSEMGLALLDVADAIRPHPEVVTFLETVDGDDLLNELPKLQGGQAARDAIQTWLDKYGMRGVGEIDITRPRFAERPTMLIPTLLGNIRNFQPGAAKRRFEHGLEEAAQKERDILDRLRSLPNGDDKATETKRMIDRLRTFAGYREYPKYRMVSRYFVFKQALMREAERLVEGGVLREREDIFYLRFEELESVVRTHQVDQQIIQQRKDAFRSYQTLTPPRVLTSDGEAVTGSYRRDDLPDGALVGLAVSAGTVEGRARVILDVAQAELEPGDILVTAYTDPSWTPLFVAITGIVTEVGGLMTHGAVIAREYGLPAVVGVQHATRLIRDGQHIRVHGTEGYVELLD